MCAYVCLYVLCMYVRMLDKDSRESIMGTNVTDH